MPQDATEAKIGVGEYGHYVDYRYFGFVSCIWFMNYVIYMI